MAERLLVAGLFNCGFRGSGVFGEVQGQAIERTASAGTRTRDTEPGLCFTGKPRASSCKSRRWKWSQIGPIRGELLVQVARSGC